MYSSNRATHISWTTRLPEWTPRTCRVYAGKEL
ncbi:hypothetical protein M3J09_003483 [Ascochyta lentis]